MPEACLALQDSAGVDVNIALFLLWHAAASRVLTAADVAAIEALVGTWRRDVVMPLREVRRVLKPLEAATGVDALRRQVKQIELEAERLQQEMLYREAAELGAPSLDRSASGRSNLLLYQALLGTKFPDEAMTALLTAALDAPSTSIAAPMV